MSNADDVIVLGQPAGRGDEPPRAVRQQLEPLLASVAETLGADSPELERFERWALGMMEELLDAARRSRAQLIDAVLVTRTEWLALHKDRHGDAPPTTRSELLQACRLEWLARVVPCIDALLDEAAANQRRAA